MIKANQLASNTAIYKHYSSLYERFSQAEDAPGYVAAFLQSHCQNKVVLDFGCGTGRFIPTLSPVVKQYFGIDPSASQLAIAATKLRGSMKPLFLADKGQIPFADASMDVAFATWVIESIQKEEDRIDAIDELLRVTKPVGNIFIIENDVGGAFQEEVLQIAPEKAHQTRAWLEGHGFHQVATLQTYFHFATLEIAQEIFRSIWGEGVSVRVKNEKIYHNVVIYEYQKTLVNKSLT